MDGLLERGSLEMPDMIILFPSSPDQDSPPIECSSETSISHYSGESFIRHSREAKGPPEKRSVASGKLLSFMPSSLDSPAIEKESLEPSTLYALQESSQIC